MNAAIWIKILLFVLELLARGMSKEGAIACAVGNFGVSAKAISRRMQ